MSFRSISSIFAVAHVRMLAIGLTLFFSASSFAQDPPLIPRKVFDAPAEHDLAHSLTGRKDDRLYSAF